MPRSSRTSRPTLGRRAAAAIAALALGLSGAVLTSTPALAVGPTIDCTTDPAILSTGYDRAGGRLTSGNDLGWEFSGDGVQYAPAPIATSIPVGFWTPSPFGNASWISHTPGTGHGGFLTVWYRYQFELAPEVAPEGFSVSLDFFADNSVGEIWVNGVAQSPYLAEIPQAPATPWGYQGYTAANGASATLDRDWQTGQNSIVALVRSYQYSQGFLAQTTSNAFCADFGDAPDSYGTSQASDGASHLLEGFDGDSAPLTLGAGVDAEPDAEGLTGIEDDAAGIDDEDAPLAFAPLSTLSQSYSISMDVVNETGEPATLAGWIDFDGDGAFSPAERATAAVAPDAATATLSWAGIQPVAGATFSRFRLLPGEVSDLVPVGRVSGGEVEDHPLTVAAAEIAYLKTADRTAVVEGDEVTYTITVTNVSDVPTEDVSFTDDLSAVLDDAEYVSGSASTGTLERSGAVLAWSGDLGANDTATVTYTVRVVAKPGGDRLLENVVVDSSRAVGSPSNCPAGSTDPDCAVDVVAAQTVDFGDAPASYGTRSVDSGAAHGLEGFDGAALVAPLMIGSVVDSETDASADDNAVGAADEDGVAAVAGLTGLTAASTEFSLVVRVHNSTDGVATLAGWIDLDGNGAFDADERAVVAVPTGADSVTIEWAGLTPVAGPSQLRLRLFDGEVADPAATGAVLGGEVEDHPIEIGARPTVIISDAPGGILAFTGSSVPLLVAGVGVVLAAAGGLVLLLRRTSRQS